jgi:neutral ceramidase
MAAPGRDGRAAMKVGAAGRPFDVPAGTPLGGYADRTGTATGTLDPLEVNCVVVQSGPDVLVLAVVDLVCVHADLAAAIGEAVAGRLPVPADEVWALATHTHSGPDVDCGTGDRSTPARWITAVAAAAADAAAAAFADRHEGTIAWQRGVVRDVGAVRSVADAHPAVPVDVLTVHRDGRLLGAMVVLPVHPTVLSADNLDVSGDLAAAVRRGLAEQLRGNGPPVWVVVATGCAGDISTRTTRRAQTPAELARLADLTAQQLVTIIAGPPTVTVAGEPPIRAGRITLSLPVRNVDDEPEPASVGHSVVADRIAHTLGQGLAVARERTLRFPDGQAALAVSAAAIGPLRILGLGAEPYLAVAELPARPAIVLGYANGYAGYLPDTAGFDRPTYESLSSPFRPDAAATAVRAAEQLLAGFRPDPTTRKADT